MEEKQALTLAHYHVVSGRDFSQPTEPFITFIPDKNLTYINAACFRRLPKMEYAVFAVYDKEKRLILKPCDANEPDSIRVRSASISGTKPKHIRCEEFMRKTLLLMGWEKSSRYKVRGYIFSNDKETILLFDLSSALVFSPVSATHQCNGGFADTSLANHGSTLLRTFTQNIEIYTGDAEVNHNESH